MLAVAPRRSEGFMRGASSIAAVIGAISIGLAGLTAPVFADEPKKAAQPEEQPAGAPAKSPPPAQMVFDKGEIQGLLGKEVVSSANEDMGRIVNVIVDRAGQPRAVVIDFGGFLGVGSRKIAVDWDALRFAPEKGAGKITLDLTRNQVKSAPEYQEGKPVVVLGASGKTQAVPPEMLAPGGP
jgi:hypothetical protein